MAAKIEEIKEVNNSSDKKDFYERFNDFLRKNRIVLAVLGIIIILAVACLGIFSAVNNSKLEKATLALESLEADYDAWVTNSDESAKNTASEAVIERSKEVIAKYPKMYAGVKASMIMADVYTERKMITEAENAFTSVYTNNPKSHLAPIALVNIAALAEDSGNFEKAFEYLEIADKEYPDAPGNGHIVFSMGRVCESMKQYDKAMAQYLRLVSKNDGSDWTNLAHDRIIMLKSLGLAK